MVKLVYATKINDPTKVRNHTQNLYAKTMQKYFHTPTSPQPAAIPASRYKMYVDDSPTTVGIIPQPILVLLNVLDGNYDFEKYVNKSLCSLKVETIRELINTMSYYSDPILKGVLLKANRNRLQSSATPLLCLLKDYWDNSYEGLNSRAATTHRARILSYLLGGEWKCVEIKNLDYSEYTKLYYDSTVYSWSDVCKVESVIYETYNFYDVGILTISNPALETPEEIKSLTYDMAITNGVAISLATYVPGVDFSHYGIAPITPHRLAYTLSELRENTACDEIKVIFEPVPRPAT